MTQAWRRNGAGKIGRTSLLRRGLLLTSGALALQVGLWSAPAMAQEEERASVDELVVTGYRFLSEDTSGATNLPVPIEKVPQSISLVSNDFVKAADLKTMGEVAQYTPGALFAGDQNPDGSVVKLRGFSAGYAIDGMPVGAPLMEPDIATIDRLEIVKGPSSVVYGAARPGGLVNLVLKSASPRTPSYISVLGGSWERLRVEGQVAGALNASGTVRGIAVVVQENANSFVHVLEQEKSVAYGGLDFDITDSLSGFVRASYQKLRRTPYEGVLTYSDGTLPAGVDRSLFIGRSDLKIGIETARLNGGLDWDISPVWSADLMFNYQSVERDGGNGYVFGLQPNGDMTTRTETFKSWPAKDFSIGASSTYKLDNLGLTDSFIATSVRYQEYRNTFNGRYVVGQVNLADGEAAITSYFNAMDNNPAAGAINYTDQKLTYLTASTQANVKVLDSVTVLGGLSWSKPTVDNRFVEGAAFENFDPGGEVSLRGAVTWEPVTGLNIYASYSESFQPQDRLDINDNALPPLTGEQYEIGAKYVSPDRRLLLTAAIFDLRQSNQQVFDQFNAQGFDRYKALGEVGHRGLELEATGQILEHLQVKAGLTLLDAKVKLDSDPTIIGERRLFLPKTTGSLYANYDFESGLTVGGGVRYIASQRTSYTGSSRDLPAYTVVDGSVSYAFDTWQAQLNVKNVFDETYYTVGYDTLFYGIRPGEPRSFTVSATKKF